MDIQDDGAETRHEREGASRMRIRPSSRQESAREPVRDASPRIEGERLRRTRTKSTNILHIDKSVIPPGMSYELKRESLVGKPDASNMAMMRENHWTPVPQERHSFPVCNDGLVLCERPKYLTDEAKDEDYAIAIEQLRTVSQNISDTPNGHLTRGHAAARRASGMRSGYEALTIPEE